MAGRFRDLSLGARLQVGGADRVRFLNGQTTRDVGNARPDITQEACILNAKGHLEAHAFLFASNDAIWLSAEPELRDPLRERLERYVIADDVTIEDLTDEFALYHFLDEPPPADFGARFCLRARRLGSPGWDVWISTAEKEKSSEKLSRKCQAMTELAWETLRVEEGIPKWGRELTPEIIPPEANLAERAIDYDKGCYIGQEVISRMKMSGQTRQNLRGLVSEDKRELVSGMELLAGDKSVGRITTAVFSARLDVPIALAIIKRGFSEPGTALIAASAENSANVRVAALPFRIDG